MIIDFEKLEQKKIESFKGGEKEFLVSMYSDDNIKIMEGFLELGASIGYHKHETNSEIIFLLEGEGKVLFDDDEEKLMVGQSHYCPKGHSHSLINTGSEKLHFYAVVPEQ